MSIERVTGLQWSKVSYFSTQRTGGVSTQQWEGLNLGLNTQDALSTVEKNHALLQQLLPSQPCWLTQVHGCQVVDADTVFSGRPEADAAVSTSINRVLSVLTADCLPVVISDYDSTVLGVAHAGWKGLAAGVLEATLAAMRLKQPQHRRLRAWIGPAISQAHFEVGAEVRDAMIANDATAAMYFVPTLEAGKYHADLAGLARLFLVNACAQGIDVMLSGECTYEHSDTYYSYRKQNITGRLATVAWLRAESQ